MSIAVCRGFLLLSPLGSGPAGDSATHRKKSDGKSLAGAHADVHIFRRGKTQDILQSGSRLAGRTSLQYPEGHSTSCETHWKIDVLGSSLGSGAGKGYRHKGEI